MKNKLILLIDALLCERKDYISSRDIHEYALLHGCNLEREKEDKYQRNSVRQLITQAKNKLKECLIEHNLQFEEIPSDEDRRYTYFRYPSAVFEWGIDVAVKFRKGHKHLRKSQLEEMVTCSKGLFPKKIMAEIFLKELKKRQRTIIEFDSNQELKNIHLLSQLFLAIRDQKVVTFRYMPFASESFDVVLHPHYLKEYNNRWFVFGRSVSKSNINPTALYSLDRMEDDVRVITDQEYTHPEVDYEKYFDEIIGVSKMKSRATRVVFRTNDKRMHGLILTKKIHRTQKHLDEWNDDKQCGRFEITIKLNNELKARFLSFGSGITIEKPKWYANEIEEEIKKMLHSYRNMEQNILI